MRCPSHELHSQLTAASKTWVGVAFIMQSMKLVSAKMNFMAIREIYGPRKLPAIQYAQINFTFLL